MPISGYKAGRTSHTPFAYHKREYSIWSSKFCSTVSVFPHPSSPKSPTPNKLPAVGPTCHTFIPTQPTPAAPPSILSLLSLHLAPSAQPPPALHLSPTGERRWRPDPDHRAAALPLLPRRTPFSRNSSTAGRHGGDRILPPLHSIRCEGRRLRPQREEHRRPRWSDLGAGAVAPGARAGQPGSPAPSAASMAGGAGPWLSAA
jgi:hypothetical protein